MDQLADRGGHLVDPERGRGAFASLAQPSRHQGAQWRLLGSGEEEPEGYTPIPADLEMAVRTQVAYDFKRRKDIGLESISFPDCSIQKVNSGEFLRQPSIISGRGGT